MGAPTNCAIYLQEFDQVSTVNIGEKSPYTSCGEMEEDLFEIYQTTLFLIRPALRGN